MKNIWKRCFFFLAYREVFGWMPDKVYLKLMFWAHMGKKLNLKNPKTFNEKLQWLKLYDRKPEYTMMVDKYAVKEYVAKIIGDEYIIPTLGVWDKFDDIDFDALPEQFVLKCTHDSGGLVICRDKTTFDKAAAKKKIEKSLKNDYWLSCREWPYKDIPKKIIAEKFMVDSLNPDSNKGLVDYKLYCFNGEPETGYISQGMEDHSTAKISYVTLDWKRAPFKRSDYKVFDVLPKKPKNFDEMIRLARILSKDTKFLRVDFYEINSKVYFGELTFYPGGGFTKLVPEEWDYKLGEWIKLSEECDNISIQ